MNELELLIPELIERTRLLVAGLGGVGVITVLVLGLRAQCELRRD